MNEYPSAKTEWYPRISLKLFSPTFKPYVHYDKSLFKIRERFLVFKKKGNIFCPQSRTRERSKEDIPHFLQWAVQL